MTKATASMIDAFKFKILAYLAVWLFFALPFSAGAEYIESFDADLKVAKNGTITIVENIRYAFDGEQHGIFRYIPRLLEEPASQWYKERYMDLTVRTVKIDGEVVPYTIDSSSDALHIKIGDSNRTISGTHTYTLEYDVRGGVVFLKYGGAELYWDVTGNDWEVAIRNVSVKVSTEEPMMLRERSCYRGKELSSGSCDRIEEIGEDIVFRASNLAPGEGMTIAQALERTKVARVELERFKPNVLPIFLLFIWFPILGFFVYRYRTALDATGTVIPQYEPYPEVKPMYSGLLIDGRLDPRDITACIVYLAKEGYLKIRKTESKVLFFFEVDDYEITLVRPIDDSISIFEKNILSLIFEHGAVVGTKVTLNTLKHDLVQQRKNHHTLSELRKDLEQDLEDSGFFQITITGIQLISIIVGISVVFMLSAGLLMRYLQEAGIALVLFIIGTLTLLTFARRRRTGKGYEALNHLKGFKEYLSVTDKERFEFHNAPEKSPEQFMEYLPYAITFGVEEKWAEVFKDIIIPTPSWYEGGTSTFSASNLSTSLGAFSTAFAASSGSAQSASSGGGSVGGGGGGGGGGSW